MLNNNFFGTGTEGKILKGFWGFLFGVMAVMIIGFFIASIFAVNAQDELPRVSELPTVTVVSAPPPTDANPNTLFAQNPIVLLILALAIGGGIPATRWTTEYIREFAVDGGFKITSFTTRILGLISGMVVSSVFLIIGMYQAAEISQFPDWAKIIGLGLVFGVMAGGQYDASRYNANGNVYVGGTGFGDGDLPDAPKAGSIKDYS